jgi:hypothetical protein
MMIGTPTKEMDSPDDIHLTKLERITNARNKVREQFLNSDENILLMLDSDIEMAKGIWKFPEWSTWDILYNSYIVHNGKVCTNGLGCTLIKRKVLEEIPFRCGISGEKRYNFIDECIYFELDALKKGFKTKHGVFIETNHTGRILKPRERTRKEKIMNCYLYRRFLSLFVDCYPIMLFIGTMSNFLYTKVNKNVNYGVPIGD